MGRLAEEELWLDGGVFGVPLGVGARRFCVAMFALLLRFDPKPRFFKRELIASIGMKRVR